MPIAIGVLIFAVITGIVIGFFGESGGVRIDRRLVATQRREVVHQGTPLAKELSKSAIERLVRPKLNRLKGSIMQAVPSQAILGVRSKLDRAGNPRHLGVATFIILKTFSVIGAGLAAVAVLLVGRGSPALRVAMAGGLVAVGFLWLEYVVRGMSRRRQRAIKKSMPDVIDLLVVITEAGTGLDGALTLVVKGKQGPLAEEFNRVLTEMRLGKPRQQAWSDMAERVGLMELNILSTALRQAEELGGSVATTLRVQSDSLRAARSAAIRELAATLSTKMLFPLIFCILPAVFIVVLGPAVMSMSGMFEALGR